jgi:predicted permease
MNWFGRLLRRGKMESDLDKELRFHVETRIAEKIAGGMTEAEARRTTQLEFGGMEQIKEECRESRGTLWLASIGQDLHFGARILARSPGFSLTAIMVLALGIGVSSLAFSLYNLVALQSMPVHDPDTLVHIERRSPENINPGVPYNTIVYFRDHARSLSAVIATMGAAPMVVDIEGSHGNKSDDNPRVKPEFVTANYFSQLGEPAAAGRFFDDKVEDSAGSPPVTVLSYRLWQRQFLGDSSIVGKTILLGGKSATVIGVTGEEFAGLGTDNPDLWLPLQQHSYFVDGSKALTDPKLDGLILMHARLAPGASAPQAAQELLGLTDQLRPIYPDVIWKDERILVTPGAHFFSTEDAFPVLGAGGTLVLLILGVACANLGGLLMARGAGRRREIQLRIDLGARKSRVFRQLFTENVLLGFLGSLAALPLSYIALRITLTCAGAPAWTHTSALPDWRVLLFTFSMGLLAAVLFGILPTLQLVRGKKEGTLWQQIVVCAQVAASCVLLILAGLLVRATLHTMHTRPEFGYEQVLSIDPGLSEHGYAPAAAANYLDQLESRLRTLPGVVSVTVAMRAPLVSEEIMMTSIDVDGKRVLIYPNWVGPEFFSTMGIPLLRGRLMAPHEKNVVLISQSLARRRWPNEDPIGKPWEGSKDIVVGVVGNTRAMELNNTDATELYYPTTADRMADMSVLVKTVGAPDVLMPSIKAVAGSVDPKLFPAIALLKSGFRRNLKQVETIATIMSLLGGIAIFLAVVGLLGLVTFAVAQRTKELAIRLALGARRPEIVTAVLKRFVWPVAIGLAAGIGATISISQIIRRMLYGISGLDPVSYAGAIGLLLCILAMAACLPIRRAFRMEIARILHAE